MRYAIAMLSGSDTAETVARYLPGNYRVVGEISIWEAEEAPRGVLIEGMDHAGWTLEDYVIPRLASGLIGCQEYAIVPSKTRAGV